MGVSVAATAGIIFWVILWSLGGSPVASFLLTLLIAVVAVGVRVLLKRLNAARQEP